MSSNEDMLRERLARLAPTAPAERAAFEGIERRITHRRRRRAAVRVTAVAAVALVAVGVASLAMGRDEPSDLSTSPTDTTATAPAAGVAPTVGQQGRVAFGGASFEVPEGWAVTSYDDGTAEDAVAGQDLGYESLCIGVPGEEPGSCAIEMYHGDPLPGAEGQPYEDHGAWSWHDGTDVPQCPFTPAGDSDFVQPLGGDYGPIDSANAVPVGDRTAVYDEWSAVCDSGDTFNPRAWHLSDEQLLIVDVTGHPETEDVLGSFRFDGAG
jgi:hypothetical protein